MSGGLAWAIVAPSVNSTMEWITDCGCTTTSIRSNPMPNSRCASMSSRPLLTSVAELIVTTGPMSQFGWARAWAGVTCSSSSRPRPRKGPPLAVSTRRPTSLARPPRRHCAMAECSESTGTIWPGAAFPATSGPPTISDSLLASARVAAGVQGGQRGGQADGAGDRVEHHVTGPGGGLGHRVRAGQDLGQRTRVAGGGGLGAQRLPYLGHGGLAGHGDHLGAELQGLGGEQAGIAAAGGQAGQPEPAGVTPHDVGGLGADRAGRAEQDDVAGRAAVPGLRCFHGHILCHRRPRALSRRLRRYRRPAAGPLPASPAPRRGGTARTSRRFRCAHTPGPVRVP